MSFRDDHEAAIARVSALEAELERMTAEREQLAADNARLEAEVAELRRLVPPPKPKRPEPSITDPRASQRKLALRVAGWGGGVALCVLMVGAPAYVDCRNQRTFEADLAHHAKQQARWHALVELEDCARKTWFSVAELREVDVALYNPRTTGGGRMVPRIESCVTSLGALSDVPSLAPVQPALVAWRTAFVPVSTINASLVEYYTKRDWKDDNYQRGPALWAALAQPLARFDAATRDVLQHVSPGVRAEIRASQRELEARRGRDLMWWRLEVGSARNELASLPLLGGTQAQVRAEAAALRALIATAPLELRREWRSLVDDLDHVEAGHKVPHTISSYQLWDRSREDAMGPIPKRPEKPAGCGGGDG